MCPAVTILNGFVQYSPDSTPPYNYGTTASYSCNIGFALSGGAMATCTGDGTSVTGSFTTETAPICMRKLFHVSIAI